MQGSICDIYANKIVRRVGCVTPKSCSSVNFGSICNIVLHGTRELWHLLLHIRQAERGTGVIVDEHPANHLNPCTNAGTCSFCKLTGNSSNTRLAEGKAILMKAHKVTTLPCKRSHMLGLPIFLTAPEVIIFLKKTFCGQAIDSRVRHSSRPCTLKKCSVRNCSLQDPGEFKLAQWLCVAGQPHLAQYVLACTGCFDCLSLDH